ncbi:hypothetical protein EMCRGX_G009827 [Ephydatia muelleri]
MATLYLANSACYLYRDCVIQYSESDITNNGEAALGSQRLGFWNERCSSDAVQMVQWLKSLQNLIMSGLDPVPRPVLPDGLITRKAPSVWKPK